MSISKPLFLAEHIALGPIDHDLDAQAVSRWTHDPDYLRMLNAGPAMPQSVSQIKKRFEAIESALLEKDERFYFTIRMREDDRIIGFAEIPWIEWSNTSGSVRLGIGEVGERRKGYGSEALNLLLRFAFEELNLFRLSAEVPAYNTPAMGLLMKFGFVEEVVRRQALNRDGMLWDLFELGILSKEWEDSQALMPGNPGVESERR